MINSPFDDDIPQWLKKPLKKTPKLGTMSRSPTRPSRSSAAPHLKDVRTEAEGAAKEAYEEMCVVLEGAGLGLLDGWRPVLEMDWSALRTKSRGGRRRVSLSMAPIVPVDGMGSGVLGEYAHIRKDPEIGRVSDDWRNVLLAVIAHELAHSAQRTLRRPEDAIAHGKGWQSLYRLLRRSCVNPRLNRQTAGT